MQLLGEVLEQHSFNQRLAQLAHETGIAMATGSMSIAMKDPFYCRKASPLFEKKILTELYWQI